jgi:DNA repair exonuclease SbcCD ATPase subunit
MTEDFNDLLDQTETRAQALVLEADKAIALLDSVDAMIDNLSSTIEESANEAKESFDTLTEQITSAEDTLQNQQEINRESMNGLMQQVQEAGGRIQERLSNGLAQFEELQREKRELRETRLLEWESIKEKYIYYIKMHPVILVYEYLFE